MQGRQFAPSPQKHNTACMQAEFILAHGTEALGTSLDGSSAEAASLERMQELLEQCAPRGLPMVVANPDFVTVSGSELRCAGSRGSSRGSSRSSSRGVEGMASMPQASQSASARQARGSPLSPSSSRQAPLAPLPRTALHCRVMPGTLARHYAACGGQVVLMGKPAPIIYAAALAMLQLPAEQVIAVGDSLEHDIGGAQAAGIDSVFVLGGIHAADVQLAPQQQAQQGGSSGSGGYSYSEEKLAAVCQSHGAAPTFLSPYFK